MSKILQVKDVENLVREKLNANPDMQHEEKLSLLELLKAKKEHYKYNKLYYFEPFEYQEKFFKSGSTHRYRFLCAANRIGKTYGAGYECALHLTGRYPDWWEGKRFTRPIKLWAVGINTKSTRDSIQEILLGTNNAKNAAEIGTGFIPRSEFKLDTLQKEGATAETVMIQHYDKFGNKDGLSELTFKSTQMGHMALAGATVDFILLDEEDPHQSMPIYTQCLTRTRSTKGQVVISATPENGLTELVNKFKNNASDRMFYQQASIYECSLYSKEDIEHMKKELPPYQHGMRLHGDPSSAAGLIYPYDLEPLTIDPIPIPNHWKRVAGVDLGFDHPTACIWSAYDADNDIIYVYGEYGKAGEIAAVHAHAIKAKGDYIPVILPHDSAKTDAATGVAAIDTWKKILPQVEQETFYNFYTSEGKKNNTVEVGFDHIRERMREGRIKFFSTCPTLLSELRNYKMKDGKVYKEHDDYCDAFRYSVMSVINRGVSSNGRSSKWRNVEETSDWRK